MTKNIKKRTPLSSLSSLFPVSLPRRPLTALLLGVGLLLGIGVMAQPSKVAMPVSVPVPASALPTPATVAVPEATAQQEIVKVVLTEVKVVKNTKGDEELVSAESIKPGDVIEYKATYTNTSDKPVTGLVADLPIPVGLGYVPKSARSGSVVANFISNDPSYAVEPLRRKLPNGKTELVPYNEYRAVRWNLGKLLAHDEAVATIRTKVVSNAPVAPKSAPGSAQSPPVIVQPGASAAR